MAPSADPDGGGPVPAMGGNTVKDNGTFDMGGLAGTRLLRVGNIPKGWSLRAVRLDGADVTDAGIEFKPGADVSGIEIELTQKISTITGSVSDGRGQPLKDYTVVIFTDDQQKWMLPLNRWVGSARPDQEGRFKLAGLPAGAYYAIALEYVAAGEWMDPEWLERARPKAVRVTLDEGASPSLELKLSSM